MPSTPALELLLALLASGEVEQPAPAGYETVVHGAPTAGEALPGERPRSTVERADIERRLPRSAPDALRYESGVFVQQTAHAQGSAFIRGLTGQQTLILFDGIRLNNSTFRQGPNQYFFTLDRGSIASLEVMRGGASTRYGSDALGGVILARPIEPLDRWLPELHVEAASADGAWGGRLQTHAGLGELRFFGGAGGRRVGLLEGGGRLRGANGTAASVPRLDSDGRTQLGTGFDELTADARLTWRLSEDTALTAASYLYRQYDAPRTDQCPAPEAPYDECLLYDEQFRTLTYAALETRAGDAADRLRATVSWQRQHERKRLRHPSRRTANIGRDDVDTFGLTLSAVTASARPIDGVRARVGWGADLYHDRIASAAWTRYRDTGITLQLPRGQYLDGSVYTYGGAFSELLLALPYALRIRGGGRLSWIRARAPADAASAASGVNAGWLPLAAHAGVQWAAAEWLELLANVDRSFRAPNLDDLTARQLTGPGYQIENPSLRAESAVTLELGARLPFAELWLFRSRLRDAVRKVNVGAAACPPDDLGCAGVRNRVQLENAAGDSEVRGIEATVRLELPPSLELRLTAAWLWGEQPATVGGREPMSRIPPLNGAGELIWAGPAGLAASAGLRWAGAQERLAAIDRSDPRIPDGGTPAFAVLDVRVAYSWAPLAAGLALENVFDAAYRYHGSSVNGPGRGVILWLDITAP